jgi:DNA-binding transcriptional regulator YiaG
VRLFFLRNSRKAFIVEANLTHSKVESQQKSYLGWAIYCLLKEKGITQAELARRLNVDRATITNWKNGTTAFRIGNLLKVLKALKIDFLDFAVIADRNTSWGKFSKNYSVEQFKK